MLTGPAAQRPLLLIVDDLHNGKHAGIALLHYLARQPGPARLFVVATVRVEEGADALAALAQVVVRVDVGPLALSAVAELATAAGRAGLAADIHARTRGHTLFVVEASRRPAGAHPGVAAGCGARPPRPGGPELEELLRAGAVLGAAVDPAVLAGLLDIPLAEALVRTLRTGRRHPVAGRRRAQAASSPTTSSRRSSTPPPRRRCGRPDHRRAADLTATPEAVAAHAAAVGDWSRAARA